MSHANAIAMHLPHQRPISYELEEGEVDELEDDSSQTADDSLTVPALNHHISGGSGAGIDPNLKQSAVRNKLDAAGAQIRAGESCITYMWSIFVFRKSTDNLSVSALYRVG